MACNTVVFPFPFSPKSNVICGAKVIFLGLFIPLKLSISTALILYTNTNHLPFLLKYFQGISLLQLGLLFFGSLLFFLIIHDLHLALTVGLDSEKFCQSHST